MQCSLCNKVALRIVGKKGFCGIPGDLGGHYAEAESELRRTQSGPSIALNTSGYVSESAYQRRQHLAIGEGRHRDIKRYTL